MSLSVRLEDVPCGTAIAYGAVRCGTEIAYGLGRGRGTSVSDAVSASRTGIAYAPGWPY